MIGFDIRSDEDDFTSDSRTGIRTDIRSDIGFYDIRSDSGALLESGIISQSRSDIRSNI